jgi:hypothetical protein
MREEVFENPVELRTSVPAPQFADRRVVMRAQPVVPLKEIRTKVRLRRLWFLSGAFAIAMMLGAASALFAIRVKRIAVSNNEIPQIEESETAITVETQALPVELAPNAGLTEAPVHQPRKPIATAPKPQAPLAQRPRIVGTDRAQEPSEAEELEQIREAVLYEQWQERRARRAARRERRNRAYDRDLSHLDEIFEGQRRRPERPY